MDVYVCLLILYSSSILPASENATCGLNMEAHSEPQILDASHTQTCFRLQSLTQI